MENNCDNFVLLYVEQKDIFTFLSVHNCYFTTFLSPLMEERELSTLFPVNSFTMKCVDNLAISCLSQAILPGCFCRQWRWVLSDNDLTQF